MTCFALALLAFLSPAASPEAVGVSSLQLLKWIDACEREIDTLHGFVLLRHGKVVAEGSWAPYRTLEETHRLSSHSKCFITTAVGILVDGGKLDLDERIVDIVPDKLPARPSPNLQSVRVRDLLTMTAGAKNPEGWTDDVAGDWVKAILAQDYATAPGRSFAYSSAATHLLGVIAERRAGMRLFDFLRERLFSKIGIERAWTTYDPNGNVCAAWGFNMTTREISLIGQLYLDKGVWNGRRILSEEWVSLATTKQTHSGKTFDDRDRLGRNDWLLGFGFNFWYCQHGAYRADGSGGQYTIVFPEQDAVLSINADVDDMQKVLDVVWRDLLPSLKPGSLPEDASASHALRARCASLALKPVEGTAQGGDRFYGRRFAFSKSADWLRGAQIDRKGNGWTLTLVTAAGEYAVPVAYGSWAGGEAVFSPLAYEPLGTLIGRQRLMSSAAVQKDGSLRVRVHQLDGMRRIDLNFRKRLIGGLTVDGSVAGQSEIEGRCQ